MLAIVLLNEQHKLLPEQKELLDSKFPKYKVKSIPAEGWTREEMETITDELVGRTVVFVSPIPLLIRELSVISGAEMQQDFRNKEFTKVFLFHNDKREKKEINGKIISVISKTGWELV